MTNSDEPDSARRDLLRAGIALAGLPLLGMSTLLAQAPSSAPHGEAGRPQPPPAGNDAPPEEAISPTEDLMREHGVLTRVLLIYEEAGRRLEATPPDLPPEALQRAAELVRSFIEDYHERLEEQYLFPRFQAAHTLVELVTTLKTQHDAGRRVTDTILRAATPAGLRADDERRTLLVALRAFVRMYLPHAAREDTVLFPALRKLVPETEYDALGEAFERREHELFGPHGFEDNVERVAALEQQLGIYDLAQFTPRA